MEITDVRIRRMEDEGKMKAVASVTFDGEFVVHDIKIVKGLNGLFVAMPSKKIGDKYKDVAHPLLPETREKIANAIFRKYEETFNEPVDAEGNCGEAETFLEE
ncbi:MAG: septation regulator SpoVG [Firmicutes bacterium]|nr:septation regulator SpoVG [Bacillota bacterium]MBQ2271512.1 septation regulator SpoVG [Bacillota bacterium]MBQ5797472.1 septation regulator SpoVG [Bacillota bacterium]MBR5000925.1 septation regulator SpoVG [Bacillota bacterium]MBR6500036.1 septation regulator SpoVG [Bacillota bacterium]